MEPAEPKCEGANKWSQENGTERRYNKKNKEDEINLFFDFKKKIALTPDNHQLLQVTGLNHPYTPNILFLITLQCKCARCLFVFHSFYQNGTHSFYTLGICYQQSIDICAPVRLQQHLILHVCVVSLHDAWLHHSWYTCCSQASCIWMVFSYKTSTARTYIKYLSCMRQNPIICTHAWPSCHFDLSTYNNLTLPHLGLFLGHLPAHWHANTHADTQRTCTEGITPPRVREPGNSTFKEFLNVTFERFWSEFRDNPYSHKRFESSGGST